MLAVITGASSGIGRALAVELASRKYDLIVVARREEMLKSLASEIKSLYPTVKVTISVGDITDMKVNLALTKELASQKVDLFINNAGFGYWGQALVEQDVMRVQNMMTLLMNSLVYFTQSMSMQMAKQGGGKIINISSIGAFNAVFPGNAVYAAAKRFVWDVSRAANFENKKLGNNVHVVSVLPGGIASEWQAKAAGKDPAHKASEQSSFKETPAPVFARHVLNKVLNSNRQSYTSGKLGYTMKMLGKLPRFMKMNMLYNLTRKLTQND